MGWFFVPVFGLMAWAFAEISEVLFGIGLLGMAVSLILVGVARLVRHKEDY